MTKNYEEIFMALLVLAKRYVKGELELDCEDGEWYARDYRKDLGGAFSIDTHGFDKPIISDVEAENKGIDIIKCCDKLGIAYVG